MLQGCWTKLKDDVKDQLLVCVIVIGVFLFFQVLFHVLKEASAYVSHRSRVGEQVYHVRHTGRMSVNRCVIYVAQVSLWDIAPV